MGLRKQHLLLAALIGVLLGMLIMLLYLRAESAAAAEPKSPAPIPSAQTAGEAPPAVEAIPSAAPQTAPESQSAPTPERVPDLTPELEQALETFCQTQTGRWGLCVQLLPEGELLDRSTDSGPMVSASLIKLYIMGAVYEKIAEGALDREQVYPSLYRMITVSDNGDANELTRLLGAGDGEAGMAAVNAWCLDHGYPDTQMNRLMLVENGTQNYTTAADCARLLGRIYRGECVSPEASREMLALLLAQQVNDRLPVLLPVGTPIAHKTGDLIGLCWADVGIVFSPGGDYVLCVISDGQASEYAAKSAAAELSLQLYRILNGSTEG